jgi:hypothetical protein
MIRTAAAVALFFVFAAPASSQPFCDNDGLCVQTSRSPAKISARASSKGCPRNLGCGCNLANYFGITGRKWRKLWVARNWAHEGTIAGKGCVGCVAVMRRGRGGHVGVVKSYDQHGNPVIYSYANGRLGWRTSTYPAQRVIAYRNL